MDRAGKNYCVFVLWENVNWEVFIEVNLERRMKLQSDWFYRMEHSFGIGGSIMYYEKTDFKCGRGCTDVGLSAGKVPWSKQQDITMVG